MYLTDMSRDVHLKIFSFLINRIYNEQLLRYIYILYLHVCTSLTVTPLRTLRMSVPQQVSHSYKSFISNSFFFY